MSAPTARPWWWWIVALALAVAGLSLATFARTFLLEATDDAAPPPVHLAPRHEKPRPQAPLVVALPVEPDTLVRGTVVAGGAPAAGVKVDVMVWPNEKVQMRLHRGEEVPMLKLDTVRTADDGRFVVLLDPARLSRRYTGDDDMIDVIVDAHVGRRWHSWQFTATRAHQHTVAGRRLSWSTYEADRAHRSQPITIDFDLDAGPAAVTEHRISD